MKNRVKLRTLTFNEEKWLWSYNYNDMDFKNYPYSYYLFVPEDNKKLKVRVFFVRYAPNMNLNAYLHEGTICYRNGERVVLNLCRPFFARQIIEYVFNNLCSRSDIGEIDINDGDNILEKLGYTDFY